MSAPKKDEIYGYRTYYREVGYFFANTREQFHRALQYFDQAIEKTPDDIRALLGRACTRGRIVQFEGAKEDIAKALEIAPNDFKVFSQKALNLYLSCDFENALIENYHHVPLRKKPDNFVMGVMHCVEAIQNCIDVRAGKPLRDHYKIIRKMAWERAFKEARPFQPEPRFKKKKKKTVYRVKVKKRKITVKPDLSYLSMDLSKLGDDATDQQTMEATLSTLGSKSQVAVVEDTGRHSDSLWDTVYSQNIEDDIIPEGKPFPFKPIQERTTNLRRYMSEKYLGQMYLDKIYLEDLIKHNCLKGPNPDGGEKIKRMTKHGVKLLRIKQEVLRTRRPFYFIRYQEATSSGTMKKRQEEALRQVREIYRKEASGLLETMIIYLKNKDTKSVLKVAEKLKNYCDSKSKKVFLEKEKYLKKLYEVVCFAHYTLKRLNPQHTPSEQEKRICAMYGLPVSSTPSKDSVVNQYKQTDIVDYKKCVDDFEKRVTKATTCEEKAWLFYELARLEFESKKFDMARTYCRKCLQEAKLSNDMPWTVNALVLVSRIFVAQKNKNDAKIELNECVQVAKNLNDINLLNFLHMCIRIVDKCDFEGPRSSLLLEKREKQIVEMLQDASLKGEASYLFRQMSSLPASRRMSVIPGIRPSTSAIPTKSGRKMSIRPQNVKTDDDLDSDEGANDASGTSFMHLVSKYGMD